MSQDCGWGQSLFNRGTEVPSQVARRRAKPCKGQLRPRPQRLIMAHFLPSLEPSIHRVCAANLCVWHSELPPLGDHKRHCHHKRGKKPGINMAFHYFKVSSRVHNKLEAGPGRGLEVEAWDLGLAGNYNPQGLPYRTQGCSQDQSLQCPSQNCRGGIRQGQETFCSLSSSLGPSGSQLPQG